MKGNRHASYCTENGQPQLRHSSEGQLKSNSDFSTRVWRCPCFLHIDPLRGISFISIVLPVLFMKMWQAQAAHGTALGNGHFPAVWLQGAASGEWKGRHPGHQLPLLGIHPMPLPCCQAICFRSVQPAHLWLQRTALLAVGTGSGCFWLPLGW